MEIIYSSISRFIRSNITNRKHSQYIPAKVYLFTQWLIGGLISIVLFLILGGNIGVITYSISLKILGLVFIDIASYSLFFYTIKRVSASFTTLVDYVVPVVGITAGYLLLDEVINNIWFDKLSFLDSDDIYGFESWSNLMTGGGLHLHVDSDEKHFHEIKNI